MILRSIAAVLAAVILAMTFTACGDGDSSSQTESSKAQSSSAVSSDKEADASSEGTGDAPVSFDINGDEMTASYYYVNELTEPDESYVKVPDLSGYTQE